MTHRINLINSYVICNYFLIFALNGMFNMLQLPGGGTIWTLYTLSVLYVALYLLYKYKNLWDLFFISFLFILIITSSFNSYPKIMLMNSIRGLPILMFYIIGRHSIGKDWKLFEKGLVVFIIVCIIGIYLYIKMPSWYLTMKLENTDSTWSDGYVLEMSRLSSFWSFPYWVSYGSAIFYCYINYISFVWNKSGIKTILLQVFLLVVMALAQQRTPLFFAVFITFVSFLIGLISRRKSKFFWSFLVLIFVLTFAIVSLLPYLDADMLERFLLKVNAVDSDFLSDRSNIFDGQEKLSVTLFGDGLGSHSHMALNYGGVSFTDQEYLKILYETGLFGSMCYGIIIGTSFIKGLKAWKANYFELSILAMYLIGMLGADCISVSEEHSAIFWFCCGRLINKQSIRYKETVSPTLYPSSISS